MISIIMVLNGSSLLSTGYMNHYTSGIMDPMVLGEERDLWLTCFLDRRFSEKPIDGIFRGLNKWFFIVDSHYQKPDT